MGDFFSKSKEQRAESKERGRERTEREQRGAEREQGEDGEGRDTEDNAINPL